MAPLRIPQENGEWLNIDDEIERVAGGGGSSGLQLLGPYTVNFDTPGLESDGAVLATLDAGTVILDAFVWIGTSWDVGDSLNIALGGDDYLPPDDDWANFRSVDPTVAFSPSGTRPFNPPADSGVGGVLVTSGALIASLGGGSGAATGHALVYALVKLPA